MCCKKNYVLKEPNSTETMPQIELLMPKMGESITEATILKWLKKVGDRIEMDEAVLEIATDKVDSEVPATNEGILLQILYPVNAVVPVGKAIAIIGSEAAAKSNSLIAPVLEKAAPSVSKPTNGTTNGKSTASAVLAPPKPSESNRFYSPLVRTIAQKEQISKTELAGITGTGQNNRVTKNDILDYVENRKIPEVSPSIPLKMVAETPIAPISLPKIPAETIGTSISGNIEIVEMDRMRKLIAEHMVYSKHTSPHVTSFVEADVTNLVLWREKVKGDFLKKYNENITFTPIFIEAVVKAIKDFPMINVSVEGTKILVKKEVNIGMATALPSGNLIVPVVKNADWLNLAGITRQVNDLAARARHNKLKPDEIQNGTFTLTNVGTFGNVMGTPIINQPQVAILATGAIQKKPAVLETEFGDVIAIRRMMFLSLSYDHRVVDGLLGGSFLRRVADYLEQFDGKRTI
jgi:2-oxoglutarate dehydrogenase E2 component (dihydrolipoamide succinyltransferase)